MSAILTQFSETKSETALVPASPELPTLPTPLVRIIGSYLAVAEDADLEIFAEGQFFSPGACQELVDARKAERAKYISHNLLPHIFAATPIMVEHFFKNQGGTPLMAITKTKFYEGYISATLDKFVQFRKYLNISPLQSAARTGDIFLLVGNLLPHILKDERLLKQARQQLIEVRQNVSDQKMLVEAANAIYAIEFGKTDAIKTEAKRAFNKIQESKEFIAQMEEFGRTMVAMRQQIEKKLPDEKTTSESKDSNYAENREFLEPLVNLLKAYIYYYTQTPKPDQNQIVMLWVHVVDMLWEYVGEWHRRLYPYLHQEFFDEKPLDPLPTFKTAPARRPRHYYNNNPLSLDDLGIGKSSGLYKGLGGPRVQPAGALLVGGVAVFRDVARDLRGIAHLYTVRLSNLDYLIENLQTLDSAKALVDDYNATGRVKP